MATQIFPTVTIANFTSGFVSMISSNIQNILVLLAVILGISVVMGILDAAKEGNLSSRHFK